jgi:lipid-A-disaccharide synthase
MSLSQRLKTWLHFEYVTRFDDAPLLVALPGSRRSEVTRLAATFGEVAAKLKQEVPDLRVVVPAAAPVAEMVREITGSWPVPPIVIDPRGQNQDAALTEKRTAFAAADVALAASGTVSLELAASATPMVIAYDMSWLSWQIMSRMALIDTVTLVNLVTDTRHIPEFLGPAFEADRIAPALLGVLRAPDLQESVMATTMERLGRGDEAPGLRAARAVLDGLG